MKPMTYEQHLDAVTTLITEKYSMEDDVAIAMVMRAQAAHFALQLMADEDWLADAQRFVSQWSPAFP